jgi:NADH-quinone oxidoreductase subunit G
VQAIARVTGASHGVIGEAANAVGGHLAGCLPGQAGGRGMNARAMLSDPRKAYVLVGIEPTLDVAEPVAARRALEAAETVIALTPWRSADLEAVADCLLPIGTFAETAGSFVNCEGRVQTFNGVIRPIGDARPAWKVLRVLSNQLGIPGFDFDSAEDVRKVVLGSGTDRQVVDNAIDGDALPPYERASAPLQRLADVPTHFADMLVRRAASLQLTREAQPPRAWMDGETLARLGIQAGEQVRIVQDGREIELEVARDDLLADGVVRLPAAHPSTAGLPRPYGAIDVEPLR